MSDEITLWYMRDNHTFKRLTGPVEEMLSQCMAEFDAGWTGGMLCTKSLAGMEHVHAHGSAKRGEFKDAARAWLMKANLLRALP